MMFVVTRVGRPLELTVAMVVAEVVVGAGSGNMTESGVGAGTHHVSKLQGTGYSKHWHPLVV